MASYFKRELLCYPCSGIALSHWVALSHIEACVRSQLFLRPNPVHQCDGQSVHDMGRIREFIDCITICDHLWVALGFDPLRFWSSFSTLQHSLLMHFTLPFSVSHPSPNISAPSPRHSLMPKGFQSSHLLWMFMVCSSVLLPWVRRIHALTNGAKSSAQLPTWNANRAFAIQLTCDRHASEGHDVVLPTRVPLNMPRFFEQSSAVLYKTCLSQDRSASATWFIHWIQDLTWSNYHFFLPN